MNRTAEFNPAVKDNPNQEWRTPIRYLDEFPKKHLNSKLNPKLSPFRIHDEGNIIKIYSLYHNLIYIDIDGMTENKKWFDLQVQYLNSLNKKDAELIYLYTKELEKITQQDMVQLNRIIKASPPLEKPLIVWRGIKTNYIKQNINQNNVYSNQSSHRVQSVSINPQVADYFMGDNCCMCQILLLPGNKCLYLGITAFDNEIELLLPINCKFKVVEETIIKNPLEKNKNQMLRMYSI